METTAIIIVGKKEFRKWVVERILALEAAIKERQSIEQEKIDELTAQILKNRDKMEEIKDG